MNLNLINILLYLFLKTFAINLFYLDVELYSIVIVLNLLLILN